MTTWLKTKYLIPMAVVLTRGTRMGMQQESEESEEAEEEDDEEEDDEEDDEGMGWSWWR